MTSWGNYGYLSPTMVSDPDDLLTTAEAAELLQVQPKTVRRWSDKGGLRCIRTPGNQRRFRRSDVDALLSPEAAS